MKVLFLDIDGVLNSVRSAVAFGGYPWRATEEDLHLFDPVGVALIQKLCDETGAKIILSSVWRFTVGFEKLAEALKLPMIGATPRFAGRPRGEEIQDWLSRNSVERYAIVDDDSDMLESQKPFFVKTDAMEGLGWKQYEALKALLL